MSVKDSLSHLQVGFDQHYLEHILIASVVSFFSTTVTDNHIIGRRYSCPGTDPRQWPRQVRQTVLLLKC